MDSLKDLDSQSGRNLGRYQVLREVGRGAMGVVYEVEHLDLGRRFALKLLHGIFLYNDTARARFVREARVCGRLRHEHIVEVVDSGTCDAGPFLAMEFVEGPTLATHLRESGALPVERGVALVLPLVSALTHAHSVGVIHRDVKPANVLLARDRLGDLVPKIGDFGIGKCFHFGSDGLTQDGMLGSLPYMAPEQIRESRVVDGRADQYSLAVLLYEVLSGRLPVRVEGALALMEAICAGKVAPLPEVPQELAAVIERAMSVQPGDRYESIADFGRDLTRFASGWSWTKWGREFGRAATHDPSAPTLDDGLRGLPAATAASTGARKAPWHRVALSVACFGAGVISGGLVARVHSARAEASTAPVRAGDVGPPRDVLRDAPVLVEVSRVQEIEQVPGVGPAENVAASAVGGDSLPPSRRSDVASSPKPASRDRVEFGDNRAPIVE
jgi:serine/threonine-protein kinase